MIALAPAPRVSIDAIKAVVAAEWWVRVRDLESDRRDRSVSRPRQVAFYLAKDLTRCSLPHIGRHFGFRDHTTVMHGIRRIGALLQSDDDLAAAVARLRAQLAPEPPPPPEPPHEAQPAFFHGPLFDVGRVAA
ncbi:MAG TPA: helix-turn-helix domain-containing protein [Allosphingosinicella sp.]|jgi:chromosomal replication initiator protein